jgi:hypothetical protein
LKINPLVDQALHESYVATDHAFLRYAKKYNVPDGSTAVRARIQLTSDTC